MAHFHLNLGLKWFFFLFIIYKCLLYFKTLKFFLKDVFNQLRVHQNMVSDKGGRGVSQFLIFSDKGERGVKPISDFLLTRGFGVVWTPPFLADIISEQPLTLNHKMS